MELLEYKDAKLCKSTQDFKHTLRKKLFQQEQSDL